MSKFKKYRRSQIAELRAVTQDDIDMFIEHGDIIHRFNTQEPNRVVSISQADLENGSPQIGDMIARNPKSHDDQWLVAKKYFEDNFEPLR